MTSQLVAQQFCIASGMAMGIDTVAHQTAIKAGGVTIAVLGLGLDALATAPNTRLVEQIADQELFLSQFPLGTVRQKFTFPVRNRLLVSIS